MQLLIELFYKWDDTIPTTVKLIPVEKIVGISRGTKGASWWDHFTGQANSDLLGERLDDLYRSLKEKGLSKFKCSFVSDTYSPIHTNYFTKHDVYIVSNDGNHRVVWAKIIDALFIRSEITHFVIQWDHYNTFRTRYIKGQEINKVFGSERARFLSLLNTMRLRYKDSGIFFEDKLITTVSIVDDKEIAIRQYKRYNQLLSKVIQLHKRFQQMNTFHKYWLTGLWNLRSVFPHTRWDTFCDPYDEPSTFCYKFLINLYNAGYK